MAAQVLVVEDNSLDAKLIVEGVARSATAPGVTARMPMGQVVRSWLRYCQGAGMQGRPAIEGRARATEG